CFTSDCFGAPMPSADVALSTDVGALPAEDLRASQRLWASVDSPWVHVVDPDRFLSTVEPLRAMDPQTILCTHLPPAVGQTTQFIDTLAALPGLDPFSGPDQAALEQMLANFEPGGAG
ncbi:MBL fold metallo-hydrolase, partial [Streptomyces sp. NPDC041003]